MRKFIFLISVILLTGAGCGAPNVTTKNTSISEQPSVPNTTNDTSATFQVNGFEFTLPQKWKLSKVVGSKAYILTDYKPYTVYLTIEAKLAEQLLTEDDLAISEKERSLKLPDGMLYETGGNGVEASYFVRESDNQIYSIFWDVESNQSAPESLGGVWAPDHNVTRDDIWSIMKTLRVIRK